MDTQTQYKVPMDHPTLAAVAGWIHRTFFQPIDNLIDRLTAGRTARFVENELQRQTPQGK